MTELEKSEKWINENIVEGTKVYYNPQTRVITTYLTPDSFIFNAQRKIDEVNSFIKRFEESKQLMKKLLV